MTWTDAAAWVLVATLLGCAPKAAPERGIRDPSVALTSSTRFAAKDFAGNWFLRGQIGGQPSLVSIDVETDGAAVTLTESHVTCDGQGVCEALGDRGIGSVSGPGRMVLNYVGDTRKELWVLWVDPDYRTAAISDRAGSFAWVIDRKRSGGADRETAAREVLEFNGFDLSQLKGAGP